MYAALGREQAEAKRTRAVELIAGDEFGISAQVLQEFYTVVTRKAGIALSTGVALQWIERLEMQPCAPITSSHVKVAIALSARYRISYWDGAILAAAESLGAPVVYSEDLNDGQLYGEVRVINPFLDLPPAPGFHEDETRIS